MLSVARTAARTILGRAKIRSVRITIGKLLAITLFTLCVGVQTLEATGHWDRTFQDTGDEAVIVIVVLCVGAALFTAAVVRDRLTPSAIPIAIVVIAETWRAFVASTPPLVTASPPRSLRI